MQGMEEYALAWLHNWHLHATNGLVKWLLPPTPSKATMVGGMQMPWLHASPSAHLPADASRDGGDAAVVGAAEARYASLLHGRHGVGLCHGTQLLRRRLQSDGHAVLDFASLSGACVRAW